MHQVDVNVHFMRMNVTQSLRTPPQQFLVSFNLNYAHNERPGRGPAQVMQFGFD